MISLDRRSGADNGADEIVPRYTCATDTKAGDQEPYYAKQLGKFSRAATVFPDSE